MLGRVGRFVRANAIALIALFFALGGAAQALPGVNVVDSGDIVNGAVKSVDIRGSAVGPSDLAPSVRPRWARINGDETVVRSRGLAATNPVDYPATGTYTVNFAAPLSSCGYSATLVNNDSELPVNRQISVARVDADTLKVFIVNANGTFPETLSPSEGFTVVVHC